MLNTIALLRAVADPGTEYRTFNQRIVATQYPVLGVRMPELRALAKQVAASPDLGRYLEQGPHSDKSREMTYEDVLLYGLTLAVAGRKMPLAEVFRYLDGLIPHFDSWAHVDVIISSFKFFGRNLPEVLAHFLPLKTDPGEFTKRTFVILLMDYFMTQEHVDGTLLHMTQVAQGQYYVDMALAWALAEALVKHYERAVELLENPVFSKFVHNKAIQKARESYRISDAQKEYLKTLKIR